MIMLYGSQQDYDVLAGKDADGKPAWAAQDVARMHEFMGAWNQGLVESGEFVDAQGLTAPVHARRIRLQDGVPVVTDGPYPETQEVLAGYTVVECESFDRATEIAAHLANTPRPEGAALEHEWYVDVRPIADSHAELEL
ncbi:YciI family protein [Thermomonospora echinospora]|nr:YciI family protein [Thermomonospora echinospora]